MKAIVLSSSLNPGSKSRVMAWEAMEQLKAFGAEADFVDIQDFPLPLSGAGRSWDDPNAKALTERIGRADAVVLALSIYSYDVTAAAKNLVELSAESWGGKAVGFICAAGGMGSYTAVMSLANSLMLNHRCLILPRFVYATKEAWVGMNFDEKTKARISELCRELVRLSKALNG